MADFLSLQFSDELPAHRMLQVPYSGSLETCVWGMTRVGDGGVRWTLISEPCSSRIGTGSIYIKNSGYPEVSASGEPLPSEELSRMPLTPQNLYLSTRRENRRGVLTVVIREFRL